MGDGKCVLGTRFNGAIPGMTVTTVQEILLCLGTQTPFGMGINTPLFSRERVKETGSDELTNMPRTLSRLMRKKLNSQQNHPLSLPPPHSPRPGQVPLSPSR